MWGELPATGDPATGAIPPASQAGAGDAIPGNPVLWSLAYRAVALGT